MIRCTCLLRLACRRIKREYNLLHLERRDRVVHTDSGIIPRIFAHNHPFIITKEGMRWTEGGRQRWCEERGVFDREEDMEISECADDGKKYYSLDGRVSRMNSERLEQMLEDSHALKPRSLQVNWLKNQY